MILESIWKWSNNSKQFYLFIFNIHDKITYTQNISKFKIIDYILVIKCMVHSIFFKKNYKIYFV